MARKLSAFERQCTVINNRLDAHPCERVGMRIYRQVFEPGLIYRTYRSRFNPTKHYCSECGSQIRVTTQKTCPVCGARFKAEPMEDKRGIERTYHMEFEAKGDIQLTRIYRVERHVRLGHEAIRTVWEVERVMYSPDGNRCVFSMGFNSMGYYFDAFSWWGRMRLRHESRTYNSIHRYNLDMESWHVRSLTEQWQYKDVTALLTDFDGDTSVLKIIAYPWAETVRKTGHEKLFRKLVSGLRVLSKAQFKALNICNRNHYVPKDYGIWLDYIEMLQELKLDVHNAHYVCPPDLMAAHDQMQARVNRKRDRKRIEQKLRAITDKERQDYVKRMGSLLDIHLMGDNLSVHPLQSIDEFAEEGVAMHHCVFDNSYYKRDGVMILSARDGDGNRLATIEYNLGTQHIMQCRAAGNKTPARDSEIRGFIESHRNDFMKLSKAA